MLNVAELYSYWLKLSGFKISPIISNSVLFPQPLEPQSETTSPSAKDKCGRETVKLCSPCPRVMDKSLMVSTLYPFLW